MDCHEAIHAIWTNRELEQTYNTLEAIAPHPVFAKFLTFVRKQDPERRSTMERTRIRRRRK